MLTDLAAFNQIPATFHEEVIRYQDMLTDRMSSEQVARFGAILGSDEQLQSQLLKAFVSSEYVAKNLCSDPVLLLDMLSTGELTESLPPSHHSEALDHLIQSDDEEAALNTHLRKYRRRAMARIVWRDLNRTADLEQTTADVSALADASVQKAMDFHYRQLTARWGEPIGVHSDSTQPMLVLGMGKLGAFELNVSSDIDLIFVYPESGETTGSARGKTLSNQEFFVRLGQKIIQSLDNVTGDGFVFRVDMRLRPYGQSGALVSNFDSLENYYQTQGREWERYAMIKARVIAISQLPTDSSASSDSPVKSSPHTHEQALMDLLRPFTYRKYIDYSAIDAMRSMKRLINREVKRKGISTDVKLGAGGIREIEFIVQIFQLIRGGRDPRLQARRLLQLLPLLEEQRFLPDGMSEILSQAYIFLRNTEHALQGYQDQQTQSLPLSPDQQYRLAWTMGFGGWDAFAEELERHRQRVNAEFQAVIAEPDSEADDGHGEDWQALWQNALSRENAEELLLSHQYDSPERVLQLLDQLRESRVLAVMQATGRERLDQFIPRLLAALVSETGSAGTDTGNAESRHTPISHTLASETLARILPLIESIARRSIYIVLLLENPVALAQLVRLCAGSPWIADQLAKYPALLDELLDTRTLYSPPDQDTLESELRSEVMRLSWDDLEGHMEVLRYFRLAHTLRVAASEVTNVLPLMKVSDYLTYIAETILQHVLRLAWKILTDKHGCPCRTDGSLCDPDFIIVGYGKLGGIELGHGSDLDLVFLHDADSSKYTNGDKSIDNQTFYTRLGQKIIHILNTQTVSGQLYEVDMRLRPSGNSGLLVSSVKGFENYQLKEAWTWEHQALVRARVIAGCPKVAGAFEQIRSRILCQQRSLDQLKEEVINMRAKMREHLGSKGNDASDGEKFHLKQDWGGIVDIEFMVQYAVLAWAHQEPELVRYTDNIRILDSLEQAGLLETQEVSELISAYKAYRSMGHRLALQRQPGVLSGNQFSAERQKVKHIWQRLLGETN